MKTFYNITKALKDSLEANNVTSVVTMGDITDVDLNRRTIFPLAHIIPQSGAVQDTTTSMSISILFMDVVDYSDTNAKDEAEPFYGNNNIQDILNTQFYAANMLVQELKRGSLWDEDIQIPNGTEATLEPFLDRFENVLAGWTLTFTLQYRNTDISIC